MSVLSENENEVVLSHLDGFKDRARAINDEFVRLETYIAKVEERVNNLKDQLTEFDKQLSLMKAQLQPIRDAYKNIGWLIISAVIGALLLLVIK